METTEKIVEAYVRYVKGWATIPNIKCPGQYEIDLLAVDPVTLDRYHIEVTVSISAGFSKIKDKPYDPNKPKTAHQRRTVDFFVKEKFSPSEVQKTLRHHGFKRGQYKKVIVTWGITNEARKRAKKHKIEIWEFPKLIAEIAEEIKGKRTYFTDDTLRTIHLFAKAVE